SWIRTYILLNSFFSPPSTSYIENKRGFYYCKILKEFIIFIKNKEEYPKYCRISIIKCWIIWNFQCMISQI
ncbi:MAG TPA: hypothetical protein DD434_00290, partial [Bacteroidales bacterium]|nr:hypothetical protein [Bacteroidales bacterium]